jgi:DivIVA domain-containing protein
MDVPANDPGETVEAAAVDRGYALAESIRGASFKVARRGYDRAEVDAFLAWIANELRAAELGSGAATGEDPDALRRELERVGESTASILRAAEQTAREVRGGAKRDAENLVASARAEAAELRSTAEDEARSLQLDASQSAEETVQAAEARAESIVEDALERRRVLAARVEHLAERRGAILAELSRLTDDLRALSESAGPEPAPVEDLDEDDLAEGGLEEGGLDEDALAEDEELAEVDELEEPGIVPDEAEPEEAPEAEEPLPDDATREYGGFDDAPGGDADGDRGY